MFQNSTLDFIRDFSSCIFSATDCGVSSSTMQKDGCALLYHQREGKVSFDADTAFVWSELLVDCRLGKLVHKKTATAIAVTQVKK